MTINRRFVLAAILITSILFVAAFYFYSKITKNSEVPTSPVIPSANGSINFNPPTDTDKKNVDANKQSIIDREGTLKDQGTDAAKTIAKPIITYASQIGTQVEVGAYVNVFEDDGTCIATFKLGTSIFNRTVKAIKNVNSTDCPTISVNNSEFLPKGKWSVTIDYQSSKSMGTSDPRIFEVK